MSRIKVVQPHNETDPISGHQTGYGTVVSLDGKELAQVRSINISIGCDEITTAQIEVLASKSLDIEVGGRSQITVLVYDNSLELEETPLANGGRRIRAVRKAVA